MADNFKKTLESVKATASVQDIVGLRVSLKRAGRLYKACCPFHKEKTPSFTVDPDKNNYKCYGCGEGGDAIQFLMDHDGLSFKESVNQIAEYYGIVETHFPRLVKKTPPSRHIQDVHEDERRERKIRSARNLLIQTQPAAGTLVETYLKSRKIDPSLISDETMRQLRFHPNCEYWDVIDGDKPEVITRAPAMVAPMQNADGVVCAAHVTYLKHDGSGKLRLSDPGNPGEFLTAKKMRGAPWGCVIRLGAPAWVMQFAEGIENGLCALISQPQWPVWITGSLGNMAGGGLGEGKPHPDDPDKNLPSVYPDLRRHGFLPPKKCGSAILIADNDMKDPLFGEAMMERASRRLRLMGFYPEILWPPAGMDLNDVMMEAAR